MPSAAMLDHLGGNVCTLCQIWKITAVDGTVAAYAAHTRSLVFDSVTYQPAQIEPTRFTQTLGLNKANHGELFGIFDSIITESDLQGGRWKNAKIVAEYVNYRDLTMGSVQKMRGQAGKFEIDNGTFRVEMRSISDLLSQDTGQLTSPIDHRRRLEDLGITITPFVFSRTVTAVVDKRNFTIGGTAQVNNYFQYGRVKFLTGANANLEMEIKANVGNAIELQLPIRSTITIGDTLELYAGYNGTREQCRDKFNAVVGFQGTPDLPGIRGIISYPE